MTDLKLLRIEDGDDQKSLIDKSNINFSNLLSYEGGPYGKIGPLGAQGDQGPTGPKGSYGDLGPRGSVWILSENNPGTTGFLSGDFWLNTSSGSGLPVYQFNGQSWDLAGFNIISQDLFRTSPIETTDGETPYSGYYFSSINPEKYTFVISDNSISNNSSSANPQYSKMVISSSYNRTGILEFGKIGSSLSYSEQPKFRYPDTGSYNLQFYSPRSLDFSADSGDIKMVSTKSVIGGAPTYIQKSSKIDIGVLEKFKVTAQNEIKINLSTSRFIPSARNISYSTSQFLYTAPIRFDITTNSSHLRPSFELNSDVPSVGGFRHRTNVLSTRNSNLFRIYNPTGSLLLNLFSSGELLYDKRINSYQSTQSPIKTGTGSPYQDSGTTVTTDWFAVVPTVVSAPSTSNNRINASNGVDYYVSLPTGSNQEGIYLWTPATGGTGTNNNGGWLNLLNPMEAITLRVRTTGSNFRFVGLGTGTQFTTVPDDPNVSSLQAIDLTGSGSLGVSDAEFTIVNIANNSPGATAGNKRWFKVYYSAWGGNLGYTKCGVMYTANSTGL